MKKILFPAALLFALAATAQQKEGKVIYEKTMQMQMNIADNGQPAQTINQTRKDNYELLFGDNKSLWKPGEEDNDNSEASGNGMQIKMIGPGQNDVIYQDLSTGKVIQQKEMMDKKFIIDDSVHKLSWKITGETKTILGHLCSQATAQRTGKRMQMNMDNGKMERKEIQDTSNITVWFTSEIPVAAGPEVGGQLPGLILELDMNHGRVTYVAKEITLKGDIASIKPPTKGKKVTMEEFRAETRKMMEEMQQNNMGGQTRIRINN